jgi:RNA polymerase-associated protein CTR9
LEKLTNQYEAAEGYFKGRNVPNLLYLSRTWYASANRDLNYSAMGKALYYAQKVGSSFAICFGTGQS